MLNCTNVSNVLGLMLRLKNYREVKTLHFHTAKSYFKQLVWYQRSFDRSLPGCQAHLPAF